MRRIIFLALLSALLNHGFVSASAPLVIYLEADRTHHQASAISIEQGFKTAFSEVNNTIQGYPVEFLVLDHRANASRSYKNMQSFAADPQALAFVAGLHSTPLLKYRDYINKNQLLTLVPWAAGGPITRASDDQNSIFRLSIDDTKVGGFLVDYALNTKQCQRPKLLLEHTPWGQSNAENMSNSLLEQGRPKPQISWFQWGINETDARITLRTIINEGADCVLLVANSAEGEVIVRAMSKLQRDKRLPIISHWGITGGSFTDNVSITERESVDLSFVQSCFSFLAPQLNDFSKSVFTQASILFDEINQENDIKAPVGFIHAYDLAKVFISAMNQVELVDDNKVNQLALIKALENLNATTQGLIKNYQRPFRPYRVDDPDAHEALNQNDYCIAHFNNSGDTLVQSKEE
ncbi:hypothetical protein DBZ36_16400 [Alginatibacterium sediminis]|uniref:Leucine-binding protein domain-containing protein n=1 Tax=Alginatibacterium sediminis TaxID=2164068 RepID=A0A420E6V0_9ALTE|nr:ABC transporter substrate-binding protein [Alginatibacterium sediminis]RKF14251.1 hypothetical protein DBZ36_16400 [Alginatibacterium sediminis]